MLKTKTINNLIHTYSDTGMYIIQVETGNEYAEAYDPITHPREYVESENKIEELEPPQPESTIAPQSEELA